jgi:N12 class adenine-specific DNA methylase
LTVEDLKEASDEAEGAAPAEQPQAEATEETVAQPKEETKKSKWVDDEDAERFEELRRRLREARGQLNMGVNPEELAIGVEMSYYVIKHGARKFAEYAKQMIEALGDWVRPYLKSFYNGARDLPEMSDIEQDLTSYDKVRAFDVTNFDKDGAKDLIAMAENVVKENEAERNAEEATNKLKKQRTAKRKKQTQYEGPDLFSGIEDNNKADGQNVEPKTIDHENTNVQSRTSEEGREGHEPQQNGAMGESTGDETLRPDRRRVGRGDKAHPGIDGSRGKGVSGTPTDEQRIEKPGVPSQQVEQPKRNLNNNHAERGTDYAPKDVDKRIAANIAAIEKMQELMESGKQATPEDMEVLRKFSGWGGLGKAFQEKGYGYGYDPTATSKRLKELLGDEGYEQANMSRNSAYYTPAKIIDTLWDIAKAMGFKGGKVLEGSAGIGNIIGLMPQEMSERSDIHAVEIDSTTGNILKLLYPDAKVEVQGFEATQVENGSIDLAITNVPFVTGLRVNDTTGDKDLSKKFKDIHDFCIAKNVRKLREGGIGIFITSSGTLDNSAKLREWIVQEGASDVVGAFRMNNETFGGTGATSDIIVVRKRVNGKKSVHAIDVLSTTGERSVEYDTGETKKVKGEYVPVVKQLSMDYNKYFVEHPEMMGGEMAFAFEHGDTYRATSKGLYPKKGIDQGERLAAFVKSMEGKVEDVAITSQQTEQQEVYADLGEGVKEGSLVINDGKLCIAQRGKAVPLDVNANKVKGHTKEECFNAYSDIKEALAAVLEYQTENEGDEGLQPLLEALNAAYDKFVATYGHLHKNTSISFLKNDVDFANIIALEKFSERGDVKTGKRIQEYGKTDIFRQRVVEKEKAPEPTNVKDGIIASIYVHGRIDVPWIVEQLDKVGGKDTALATQHTEQSVKEEIIKSGLGFENPSTRQMEVSYEYLSGNVREKLAHAQQNNADGRYDTNIKALESVIPMNIPAHLIDFSIGSSWIDPKLYEDYVKERTDVEVTLTLAGGTWYMRKPGWLGEQKNRSFGIVSQMLGKTIMGTDLIEAAMQNKTITVSETRRKYDGSTETVTDKDATTACADKIDEIRQDFKDWARGRMQSDAAMSEHIEKVYNEMFNNYVPKSIPDDFVPEHFGGAATMVDGKPFALRPHQGKAVVRGTTQPLLLAHEVGTGKTYTLITTAMEMRRLGTARKPMIVVQNSTVGQFVESAKKLYPNAKVLTIEDKDHTAEGRKNFYAKIKYNDWDMIVVPQSVFERIPDSEERQMAFVQDKIEEKELVLEQMKDADPDGNSLIVRQAEKEIEKLNEEMGVLTGFISDKRKEKDAKKAAVAKQNAEVKALEMLDRQTDDVENFDDMGIDAILVDEAHEYKHLGFATAMQRGVKGVDPSYSKKAQGVFLKTQAVLEKNNGRNVVFATGTPISNTAAEIWTFMRYLMPSDTLKDYGIYYFDDFVRNFGNLTQMLEFTTSGKFKENNRFAGYVNLPELVRIWSGVADTVLTNEAGGVSDKIPDMEGGKAQDIYLPQTKALRSVMKHVKSELDRYDKMTGKEKKENSHIPLTMYGIAKAAAVDARLVVSNATDDPQSKTNEAVRQTLRSLEDTKSYNGTVALFADNYQNRHSGFNLYEDIREKLIEAGVPEEQIVVMKSGMSVKKKLEIFDRVNRGEVRVIMGSTFTLGTGVNIQERLHTLIHLDAPNRPMDYTQRNGRILRQGNLHKDMDRPVRVLRFGVEDSLDVTAYQRLKTKGAIADSIMNGKQMMSNSMENRVLEEEEDVFGDTVAQLSGSEYAMLKNQAEKDVRKYENKKKQWEADQTYCHNEIPRLESKIRNSRNRLESVKAALEKVEKANSQNEANGLVIEAGKKKYDSLESMADFIKDYNKKIREIDSDMRENPYKESEKKLSLKVTIGGFDFVFTTEMTVDTQAKQGTLFTAVRRNMTYTCEELGLEDMPVKQSLLREGLEDIVDNVITGKDFRERIDNLERGIEKNESALAQVKERDGKPFGFSKELEAAHKHYDEYSELMKKEMEEKEKKYAAMDSDVEEASEITNAEEAEEEEEEERLREGEGNQTVEVSYEESLASSRAAGYSKKQHDAMIARRWKQRVASTQEYAKRLGLEGRVNVVLSADEVEGISERKKRAKGWFDPKTGKIVVVLYNHTSMEDVIETLQHEGVAHYGLRAMYGKHFDEFLDAVFANSKESIRKEIVEMSESHGWNIHTGTEEYLAKLAEDTDFEKPERQTWWSMVKQYFHAMLQKLLGRPRFAEKAVEVELSDNELRYILWCSYENLREPGRYVHWDYIQQARDIAMQSKLKVGEYKEDTNAGRKEGLIPMAAEQNEPTPVAELKNKYPGVAILNRVGDHFEVYGEDAKSVSAATGLPIYEDGIVRFSQDEINDVLPKLVRSGQRVAIMEPMEARKDSDDGSLLRDGDFSERDEVMARDYYERMVSQSGYQFREAMQDSMLGLRKAYEAILGKNHADRNRSSFRIEEVPGNENAYLAENRMSSANAAEQHNYFQQYMQPLLKAIHKICGSDKWLREELTDYMMAKHGLERNEKFAQRDFAAYQQQNPTGGKSFADFRERDYAGLTALTGMDDVHDAELAAQQIVADFESQHDVSKLWAATKRATGVTLAKIYRSGLLSKESYEQIRDMFEWYIPLQGFDETTSDEVYGYLTSRQGPMGSPIKHAKGRSSKADDPIATIGLMADMAIRQANRNEMKKLFLNFVQNHPSDLVSVSRLWLQHDDVTDEWVPVFADIEESDTAADVERKVTAFEQRMEQLAQAEPDKYKRASDAKNLPYRVLPGNLSEHQVLVKRNGETFVLTINGNPRAAQALNGLTNPDVKTGGFIGGAMKLAQWMNHQMSAAYTTRTPDFVVSNFFRDMLYSNCMTWVKEGGNYALKFHKNFGKMNPVTMRKLFGKWEKGTLDDSKPTEYMFKQFMMNGGETGYTNVRDIEAHKREIVKELKRQGSVTRKVWHALGMQLDLLNRSVENCARFAAFITSQEMGRSIERSIYDAKEVSVNFNKKGSGDKMIGAVGQTNWGKIGSFISGGGRLLYVFWNAGTQGMTNFMRAAKRNPGKFSAGAAVMFTLGAVIPLLAKALAGDGDDDDKNAYYNLPEYVRRSNICFRVGDAWITIPLPIEFRAIYGLGELGTGVITGEEHYSDGELARQLTSQVSQILPLDFMEGGGGLHAFIPSQAKPIVEAASNKSWTGLPIYKDTPFNQSDPEFTKVYKNADSHIVGASKWLNELTGGDDYKKGWADVVNPAQVEYVLNGYFGGWFKVPTQLMKMGETAWGDREFEWRNMMLANRLVKNGDERTANRKLLNEYFELKKEYEETKRLLKKYEKAKDEGALKYAEKLDFLNNSEEYARYEIFDEYRKEIDNLWKDMKEQEGEERKATEAEYYSVMREMVNKVHAYERGKK